MRSRFRLLALLMACAFFLTAVFCIGSQLQASGISLSSLPALTSVLPSLSPAASPSDAPEETLPADGETPPPEPDNSPDPEYNTFGL